MRQARILDVLRTVTAIAAAHPEVEAWWYAPPIRLRLRGQLSAASERPAALEIVVQTRRDGAADCDRLGEELSHALGRAVTVRAHRGGAEERHLFRMVSRLRRTEPPVECLPAPLGGDEVGA